MGSVEFGRDGARDRCPAFVFTHRGGDGDRGSGVAAQAAHIVVTQPTGTTVPDLVTRAPVGSQRSGRAGAGTPASDGTAQLLGSAPAGVHGAPRP